MRLGGNTKWTSALYHPINSARTYSGNTAESPLTAAAWDKLADFEPSKAWRIVTSTGEAGAAQVSRDDSGDLNRGSEQIANYRSILKGCRQFIGGKSPALAEKFRRRKWRT